MEESVNLEKVLEILKKNMISILLSALLVGGVAALITFFLISPRYEAQTQILVSQSEGSTQVDNQDIEASLQLIHTYRDIIKSPIVLETVISNLGLQQTMPELSEQISVDNEDQSQVLNVTVLDESAEDAEAIANEAAEVFQAQITGVMNIDNVSILSPAILEADTNPVSPQPLVNITIGIVAGLLLGLTVAFSRAFFDKSVKNETDAEKHLNIPVVGSIEKFED
ncbi:YveK family protein [Salinicoccus albus]|uniref:YveK family protein n=1 Tax=Salinicoccus albus TaxID=418756 RepID=UPI00036C2D91|nr:Wzz/FepE/Etk N-terminal domain-containing protein [Salinicoccus albus]